MPTDPTTPKDRALLRAAGEHLGTLAEREYERLTWTFSDHAKRRRCHERYAKLHRLSRELMEIAHAD